MTHPRFPSSAFLRAQRTGTLGLGLTLAWAIPACQSSGSAQQDAAAPATEAERKEESPTSGSTGPIRAAASEVTAKKKESQREAVLQEEVGEGASDGAAEEEPGSLTRDELLDEEQPAAPLPLRLAAEQDAFDAALDASELSCSAAGSHRDAICAIAERLCARKGTSVVATDEQCKAAEDQCKSVRERYRDACGE